MQLQINNSFEESFPINNKSIIKLNKELQLDLDLLTLHLLTDEALLEINQTFLKHDYYTDIITFDLRDEFSQEAELYISIERVKENAKTNNLTFSTELSRVIIHGLLHLSGYNDKTENEKNIMRTQEDHFLGLLFHVETTNK